jgi:hypothetical protein
MLILALSVTAPCVTLPPASMQSTPTLSRKAGEGVKGADTGTSRSESTKLTPSPSGEGWGEGSVRDFVRHRPQPL